LFGWRKGIAAIRIFMRHNSTRLALGMPLEEEIPPGENHISYPCRLELHSTDTRDHPQQSVFAHEGSAGNTCNENRFSL
jgi:hypothetical protein